MLGAARSRLTFSDLIENHWGEGGIVDVFAPSVAHDDRQREGFAAYERASASPSMARALIEAVAQTDVTDVLPEVRVPTLVLHRRDEYVPVEAARAIAAAVPGARLVELEGIDHLPFLGDSDAIVEEVEEFLTGARHVAEPERALATVMFTDIVRSTERAAELGDTRWRDLLQRHDELVGRQIERSRGRKIKSTGDGVLATFDGPARAIRCAGGLVGELRRDGIEIRAGIHTGECELLGDDVAGMAVHIGARIAALASSGEVLVSSTVKDLVAGSQIEFAPRGAHVLKGVPGEWQLFRADGGAAVAAA
jgi:class 3 adenylate cyclase